MRLLAPTFRFFSVGDDATWWYMTGPSGREVARAATPESSIDAAHAAVVQVIDSIDLFSASARRTESMRWQWFLVFDLEPVVWGAEEYHSFERCERSCRRFTLLAPLADVDTGHGALPTPRRVAAHH